MGEKEVHKDYKFVETVPANRINWGAILGGTAIGLFVQTLFVLLGIAIGVTALDPGEQFTREAGVGTAIYLAIATIISVFVGAWSAGRFSGLVLKNDGMLHGVATLALLTLISLFAVSQGIDSALTHGIRAAQVAEAQGIGVEGMTPGVTPEERTGAAAPLERRGIYSERANEYSETAAWTAFITGLISLAVAAAGGVMGMRSRPIRDEHRPLSP